MVKKPPEEQSRGSELILYQTEDGKTRLEVRFEGDTAWLSQSQMAELFQTTKQNISLHIKNIFNEGELDASSVVKDYLTTADDGKEYSTYYYNLDVIISVGYPPPRNYGGKPWKYLLIPHDAIAENMTLGGLAGRFAMS